MIKINTPIDRVNDGQPYLYCVFPNEKFAHYWTGSGWTDRRSSAKTFRTEAEAEEPLRKMMREGLKVKMGWMNKKGKAL